MKRTKPTQPSLIPRKNEDFEHGGGFRKGKRKVRRPFSPKVPMHLVVRSTAARASWSMLHPKHEKKISELIRKTAKFNRIRIYRFVNVGNHLHLLVQAHSKDGFKRFLRTVTGRIAALVTGAIKGRPQGKFWDKLAYSRLVSWGRDLKGLLDYFTKNELESVGFGDLVTRLSRRSSRREPLQV